MPGAILVVMFLALLAAGPAPAADTEEPLILAAVQKFFDALSAGDPAAVRAVVLPGGLYTAVESTRDGNGRVGRFSVDESFSRSVPVGLHEHMWSPRVVRRGQLATVTGPYEFRKSGVTTHCGVDVFTLVKTEGTWSIASFAWTAEPDACPELKAGFSLP